MPEFILDKALFFAVLAIIVSVIRYGTYFWAIYKKEARPHVFSWFLWGVVTGIGAYAQFSLGGGPSSWVLMLVSATCLLLSFIALFVGEKNITKSDWFAFVMALFAIPVWQITNNPLLALFVVISIDILSYFPTARKSWSDPWGEPPGSYFWAGLRYFLTLFAVPNPSFATLLYPFVLMVLDWGMVLFVVYRRSMLKSSIGKS